MNRPIVILKPNSFLIFVVALVVSLKLFRFSSKLVATGPTEFVSPSLNTDT